jgi:uncharacterized membrane protein
VTKISIVSAAECLFGNVASIIVLRYVLSFSQYIAYESPFTLQMVFSSVTFLHLGYVTMMKSILRNVMKNYNVKTMCIVQVNYVFGRSLELRPLNLLVIVKS